MSPKDLQRYVDEFAGRHNLLEGSTMEQMQSVVTKMVGKSLMYRQFIADNGLDSGARARDDASHAAYFRECNKKRRATAVCPPLDRLTAALAAALLAATLALPAGGANRRHLP